MFNRRLFVMDVAPICGVALLLFTLLLTTSCSECKSAKEDDEQLVDTIPADSMVELLLFDKEKVPETVDANFDDFLYAFITDEDFFYQRVKFPLPVNDNGIEKHLTKAQWDDSELFRNQDLLSFVYTDPSDLRLVKSDSLTDVSIEWIDFKNLSVDKYVFHRDKQWMLMNLIKTSKVEEKYTDFADFYVKFMTDSLFRDISVCQPLTVVSLPQGEMSEGGTEKLTLEQWHELHLEMPMPNEKLALLDYDHNLSDTTKLNLLVRSVYEPLFATYKFQMVKGSWMLYEVEF